MKEENNFYCVNNSRKKDIVFRCFGFSPSRELPRPNCYTADLSLDESLELEIQGFILIIQEIEVNFHNEVESSKINTPYINNAAKTIEEIVFTIQLIQNQSQNNYLKVNIDDIFLNHKLFVFNLDEYFESRFSNKFKNTLKILNGNFNYLPNNKYEVDYLNKNVNYSFLMEISKNQNFLYINPILFKATQIINKINNEDLRSNVKFYFYNCNLSHELSHFKCYFWVPLKYIELFEILTEFFTFWFKKTHSFLFDFYEIDNNKKFIEKSMSLFNIAKDLFDNIPNKDASHFQMLYSTFIFIWLDRNDFDRERFSGTRIILSLFTDVFNKVDLEGIFEFCITLEDRKANIIRKIFNLYNLIALNFPLVPIESRAKLWGYLLINSKRIISYIERVIVNFMEVNTSNAPEIIFQDLKIHKNLEFLFKDDFLDELFPFGINQFYLAGVFILNLIYCFILKKDSHKSFENKFIAKFRMNYFERYNLI